jgi:uncharacterized membrane protein YedE/YeeE
MLPAYAMPLQGTIGGLLIGTAAALMLLGLGRIAGVSGLAARATGMATGGAPWSIAAAFVIGLPIGAVAVALITGSVAPRFPGTAMLVIGGVLVGFGTRLGSGCTSGHGVCGMARLSPRSLAATGVFMASGIATVAVMNSLEFGW